jgi:hypothetical protein
MSCGELEKTTIYSRFADRISEEKEMVDLMYSLLE